LKIFFLLFVFSLISYSKPISVSDWEINDDNFKFTVTLPDEWKKTDSKVTDDKDAVSYSLERKDKKCSIMILAFKLTAVKNLEDFIYTLEKDATLNIPSKSGDYTSSDSGNFDFKSATYKDQQYMEEIWYYRTKLPDAPNNYVYMLRFITTIDNFKPDIETQIKKIADSFLPTAQP
jgi:hypothetical protein